jgi:hypothetical protein
MRHFHYRVTASNRSTLIRGKYDQEMQSHSVDNKESVTIRVSNPLCQIGTREEEDVQSCPAIPQYRLRHRQHSPFQRIQRLNGTNSLPSPESLERVHILLVQTSIFPQIIPPRTGTRDRTGIRGPGDIRRTSR